MATEFGKIVYQAYIINLGDIEVKNLILKIRNQETGKFITERVSEDGIAVLPGKYEVFIPTDQTVIDPPIKESEIAIEESPKKSFTVEAEEQVNLLFRINVKQERSKGVPPESFTERREASAEIIARGKLTAAPLVETRKVARKKLTMLVRVSYQETGKKIEPEEDIEEGTKLVIHVIIFDELSRKVDHPARYKLLDQENEGWEGEVNTEGKTAEIQDFIPSASDDPQIKIVSYYPGTKEPIVSGELSFHVNIIKKKLRLSVDILNAVTNEGINAEKDILKEGQKIKATIGTFDEDGTPVDHIVNYTIIDAKAEPIKRKDSTFVDNRPLVIEFIPSPVKSGHQLIVEASYKDGKPLENSPVRIHFQIEAAKGEAEIVAMLEKKEQVITRKTPDTLGDAMIEVFQPEHLKPPMRIAIFEEKTLRAPYKGGRLYLSAFYKSGVLSKLIAKAPRNMMIALTSPPIREVLYGKYGLPEAGPRNNILICNTNNTFADYAVVRPSERDIVVSRIKGFINFHKEKAIIYLESYEYINKIQ